MTKRSFLRAAGAAAAGVLLQACGGGGGGGSGGDNGGGGGPPAGSDTLLGLLQQDGNFSAMASAIDRSGLAGTLGDANQDLTLFAADNASFDRLATRLGLGSASALIDSLSPAQWDSIVNYCLLPSSRVRSSLVDRADTRWVYRGDAMELIFATEAGQFNLWDGVGRFTIQLVSTDTPASNGILHVTDDLLLPRGVLTVSQMLRASTDSYAAYAESMVATGMVDELDGDGPFTVFAPRTPGVPGGSLNRDQVRNQIVAGSEIDGDDFQPQQTLSTLSGRQVVLRDAAPPTLSYGSSVQARVIDVDFWASNGVIHTIDQAIPL